MWWKTIILITVSMSLCMQAVWADSVAVKPTTPVQISITPETDVAPGATGTFVVRASSSVASEAFHIEITPPAGTQVVSGELQWRGSVIPGEVRELRVTIQLPADQTPTVTATAGIESNNSARLAARAVYRSQSALPAAFKATQSKRKSLRYGRPVVEYSLK